VVGRVGRAHGVRGDATVDVRTDEPERRFAVGSSLITDRDDLPTLVVAGLRWHSGRLLCHFEGIDDRTAIEALRGTLLSIEVDAEERPDDPDEFYDHQLVGLAVVDRSNVHLGVVVGVVHGAQDLLVVRPADGPDDAEALVPFVKELVPQVDLDAGRMVASLPAGLLDLPAEH
jgi:16S rRNA processing protein RimM